MILVVIAYTCMAVNPLYSDGFSHPDKMQKGQDCS